MKNKLILFILMFFTVNVVHAQDSKEYLINTKILIDCIDLKIHHSAVYIAYPDKELSNIILYRNNEGKSKLIKKYQSGREEGHFYIDNSVFDEFVLELKKLDIEKIVSSNNFNIYDGSSYDLKFGNYTYTIIAHTNSPEINTEKRGLTTYINLCKRIWELAKQIN